METSHDWLLQNPAQWASLRKAQSPSNLDCRLEQMTLISWASDFGSSAILLHGTVLRVFFHFKNKMNFALAVDKCEKVSSSEAMASLAGPEAASGSAYTPKA